MLHVPDTYVVYSAVLKQFTALEKETGGICDKCLGCDNRADVRRMVSVESVVSTPPGLRVRVRRSPHRPGLGAIPQVQLYYWANYVSLAFKFVFQYLVP